VRRLVRGTEASLEHRRSPVEAALWILLILIVVVVVAVAALVVLQQKRRAGGVIAGTRPSEKRPQDGK